MSKQSDPALADLRRRAEEKLLELGAADEVTGPEETRRLLHEIRVQQTELEIQNEELRQAKEALRESEETYRSLFANNHATMLLLDPETGGIVDANPAACDYYGFSREELQARKITDLNTLTPEETFREMQAAKTEVRRHFEFRHRLAGGVLRDVEVYSGPIQKKGKTLLYSIVHDITTRKEAEQELRRMASFPELNPNPVMEVDEDGGVIYANPAAQQVAATQELPEGVKAFLPPDMKEFFVAARQGGPGHHSFDVHFKDTLYAVTLYLPSDSATARLYALEITARQRAEEALQLARQELELRVAERTAALRLANEALLWEIEERLQAEAALTSERQRFYSVLEELPAFIYLQGPDYSIRFANRMFRERFGDPEGKTCYTLLWGQEEPCPDCPTFSVFRTGKPKEWEWQGPGGRYYQIYDYPVTDVDGSPLVLEMGIDISGHKRAEEIVREQARQLEAFFTHNITPLVFLDANFHFIRVNESYARACRREAGEFIGRNHFEFYPHAENEAIFRRVVETKTPYVAEAKAFTFPDHPEWGVTYWDWTLSPIINETGEVDFLVFSLQDVTERVQAQADRNRLIDILEATPDLVGMLDKDRRVNFLNRSFRHFLGVKAGDDFSQVTIEKAHPPWAADLVRHQGLIQASQAGVWQGETEFLTPAGRVVPFSQVILAHKDAAGQVQAFSTVARDISDLKEAQANSARQAGVLNGMNRILREALTCETEEELGRTCLAVAEELTDSDFGFIDKLTASGSLELLAIGGPGQKAGPLPPIGETAPSRPRAVAGLYQRIIFQKESVKVNEPAIAPNSLELPEGHPGLRAFLGVPLRYGGKVVGQICLANRPGGFTPADQETVEVLAVAIAEAVQHHRAAKALRESEEKLRYLADQLLTSQENERKRLASELHDELGHALLTLKLNLGQFKKDLLPEQDSLKDEVDFLQRYIGEVLEGVRRLYHDLSPGDLEDLGLTTALRNMVEDFMALHEQTTWRLELPNLEGLFPLAVQTIIYRVFQEALTNIGKHAEPSEVDITATCEGQQVGFVIADNGRGFNLEDLADPGKPSLGLGLMAMEERLKIAGGSLTIWSKPGEGVRLSFNIPAIRAGEQE